jgi:hypothetical protein
MRPKTMHAVTAEGFELRVFLLVLAYSLNCVRLATCITLGSKTQRGVGSMPVTDRPLPDCDIRVREVIPWRAIPQMPPPRGVDLPPRCSECLLLLFRVFVSRQLFQTLSVHVMD